MDVELAGLITKAETKKGDKARIVYTLTTGEGKKIQLPIPKPPKKKKKKDGDKEEEKKPEVINLDDYLDVAVKISAKAIETKRKDEVVIRVRRILTIEKRAE